MRLTANSGSDQQGSNRWSIVVFGFICLSFSYSVRAAFSLIMPMLENDYGWTRSSTSSIAAMALLVMAVVAPLVGRFADIYAPRVILVLGALAMAAGCFLAAWTDQWVIFMLAFGGVAAIGFGLIAPHVISTVIEQKFVSHQGLAISISTSGSTAGQFVVIPLIAMSVSILTWQASFQLLGLACLGMAIFVYRYFPSEQNQKKETHITQAAEQGWLETTISVLKIPAFHILFWSYVICGYTTTGVIETHFLPFASYCGIGPVPSATAFGILSAVNMVGMILVGWLTDRMNGPLLLAGIYAIRSVSFLLLLNADVGYDTLVIFAIIFGLVDYSTFPVTARLVATHIGKSVVGLSMGLILGGHQLGAAAGAYFGGYLFDIYLRYDWVWWSSIWITILAGVMVLLLLSDRLIAKGNMTLAR